MNANSTRRVVVEPGGTGVAAHVGLHALGTFADRLGLGDSLSSCLPWAGPGIPLHDRGKVLVQIALVLAGGGESCLDIEFLRTGDDLFGAVPSDTTVARTFHEITSARRAALVGAVAQVRAEVWRRSQATKGKDPVVLDIDASLVEIHSENKEQAAPTYKGGYGFHPMFCFADATGETLSALLRPGNAGANTVADHISVLDSAITQLPGDVAAGHRAGDGRELVEKAVVVRADSAGCTEDFLKACRERHVGFYVSARSNAQITAAIFDAIGIEEVWLPALAQDGEAKDGAAVAELTSLIEDRKLPSGTRLIVRREPLHPGAQRSLFPSLDYRYWGVYTDQDGPPRPRRHHACPCARRTAHLSPEGLGTHPVPLHQLRGQLQLADDRRPLGRPRAVVPSAVLRRQLARRPTEGPPAGHLPHSWPSRPPGTTTRRAHHRRLADRPGAPRCLPTHRRAPVSTPRTP